MTLGPPLHACRLAGRPLRAQQRPLLRALARRPAAGHPQEGGDQPEHVRFQFSLNYIMFLLLFPLAFLE